MYYVLYVLSIFSMLMELLITEMLNCGLITHSGHFVVAHQSNIIFGEDGGESGKGQKDFFSRFGGTNDLARYRQSLYC